MKHLLPHLCWLWITITLIWDAPTHYENGAPLPPGEIHHYNIYRRFHGAPFNKSPVAMRYGTACSETPGHPCYIWDMPPTDFDGKEQINVWDWAVTAVATNGLESVKSNVITVNSNGYATGPIAKWK